MPSAHEIYNISSKEISEAIKIGFKFHNSETKTPEEFINNIFPGFRLLVFLKEIESLLGPLANAAVHKHIQEHDGPPPTLGIRYYSDNYDDDKSGLLFSRTFIREIDHLLVSHDYLVCLKLPEEKKLARKYCPPAYNNI